MTFFYREHLVNASRLLECDEPKASRLLGSPVHHDDRIINDTERTEILAKLSVVDGVRQPTDEYFPVAHVLTFRGSVSILTSSLLILLALTSFGWSIFRLVLRTICFSNILDHSMIRLFNRVCACLDGDR